MNDWQPPFDDTWYNISDVNTINSLLALNYSDLIEKVEFGLFPLYSADGIDDFADWIERWIRKRLRTWSGGNLSEFVVFNPQLSTGKWRTDYYLQDIFRVICNDSEIQIYLRQLVNFPVVEQILRIAAFLIKHPVMKNSRFTSRRATWPMSVLIYHIGPDKIMGCTI